MNKPLGPSQGTKRMAGSKASNRSALGDISNRTGSNNNGLGFRAVKKAGSKPFEIASVKEKPATHQIQPTTSLDDDVEMVPASARKARNVHYTPIPEIDRADAHDLHNPKYAAEYVNDIYKHFRDVETTYLPSPSYMDWQEEINTKMRALLVDWLIQVHVKFELLPQTLYLTVNVLDRYLDLKPVSRPKLQLVGCAAMLVASKYEEIYAPECMDFVKMSDKAFTVDELLKMEGEVLNALKFNLTTPSPYTFLRRYMKVACSSARTQHFATFLIERSLQEYEMLQFCPSKIAAAALYIAQSLTDERRTWGSTLTRHSTYTPEMFQSCMDVMTRLYSTNQVNYLQAVSKKYSGSKYMHVSLISLA